MNHAGMICNRLTSDTNKLVGIGFLPGLHTDSARFGWRYDLQKGQIEIFAYCYLKGRRDICHIAFVEIGKWYRLELLITTWSYFLSVIHAGHDLFKPIGEVVVRHDQKRNFQYRLGTFFGGNGAAPYDMQIQIEKA